MFDKIKSYWNTIIGALLFILAGAFLYEREKRAESDAIVDNKADLDKINEMNKQVSANDGQLQSEEQKREEIKKAAENAKSDNSDDPTKFLGNR